MFALPDGRTIMVGNDGDNSLIRSRGLGAVAGRWARIHGAQLVLVTDSGNGASYQ